MTIPNLKFQYCLGLIPIYRNITLDIMWLTVNITQILTVRHDLIFEGINFE